MAKILAFPQGGRAAAQRLHADIPQQGPMAPRVDAGAWYHQAAIEEGRRAPKQ